MRLGGFRLGLAICWVSLAMPLQAAESFYHPPRSYGSTRDPDPPRYVKPNWIEGWDLGLDYRLRAEYHQDDLRQSEGGVDRPLLHRTRLYLGLHDLLDPFRFAVELQDARREHSRFERTERDVNELQLIRLYAGLHFQDLLGHDAGGNARPLWVRYGIHNLEFLDRRLLANNQWRNTTNTFQGVHASMGQESNDWQLEYLGAQPMQRRKYEWDQVEAGRWLHALVGHYRGLGQAATLEPFYLGLLQEARPGIQARRVHAFGLRAYGVMGQSPWDYDLDLVLQRGQDGPRDLRAYGGNAELGYCWLHSPGKPRFSAFYGYASGDRDPNDGVDQRFEKFYGFGRPWSAADYGSFENLHAPKLRLEVEPHRVLRVDAGWGGYWLASSRDRFKAANLRDQTGASGSHLGQELDARLRWQASSKLEMTLGYSHFFCGGFVQQQLQRRSTEFLYLEVQIKAF